MKTFTVTLAALCLVFITAQARAQMPFTSAGSGQFPAGAIGTALSEAAASIGPGEWAEVSTTGLVAALDGPADASDPANTWGDWLLWNPATTEAFFMGGAHQVSTGVFVKYSEETNAWTDVTPIPEWLGPFPTWSVQHAWDHGAIDPARGEIWRKLFNNNTVMKRYTIATNTWDDVSITSGIVTTWRGQIGVTWAEDIDALLLFIGNQVVKYDRTSGVWSSLGTVAVDHTYETFIEYNPVKGAAIFGGGQSFGTKLHKVTGAGVISDLGDAPFSLEVQSQSPVVTYDPVSGDFLAIDPNTNVFYKYNIDTDTWTLLTGAAALPTDFKFVAATPVPELGVVFFANMLNRTSGNAWVYKHANP